MNTNKNFLRFMGYRKMVVAVTANGAGASGHAKANTVDLTLADFGNIILPGTAGTDLEVVIEAKAATSAGRGTKYTHDDVTGGTFTAAANTAIGEFTRMASADLALHASDGTLTFTAQSGVNGYDLKETDLVTVVSYLGAGDANTGVGGPDGGQGSAQAIANAASTAFTEADGILVPAANYLGADPISATTTRLSFKSLNGTAVDDDILLTHGSGKFKAVCEMMQAAVNAGSAKRGRPLVITDPRNAIVPFSGQFDLGITECHITNA
tara:strand:+ start:31 stop:831 length:801 start_codon:yes stop_codon:yes gene_type:complete